MKLHLLNGDSILQQFHQTNIAGDTIVWREILCEGKIVANLADEEFWFTRQQFLQQFVADFDLKEYEQLKRAFQNIELANYEEVILWFEYDLFCQINLLGALSWLYAKTANTKIKISLICVGTHPNYSKLVALGNLSLAEFAALYPSRKALTAMDLAFASRIWAIYCSANQEQLLIEVQQHTSTAFPYLEAAMYQHQKRFPSIDNGLTDIESKILELLRQNPCTKRELVGTLLKMQEVYGFGDLQYFKFVEDLKPLLKEEAGCLFVNQLGQEVLANRLDFSEMRVEFYDYGGANLARYRWDKGRDAICRI